MIELPWPPSSLSGHNDKHYRVMRPIIAKHREWARSATLAAMPAIPATGDIRICVTFHPPNRRGDRINFSNRMKPYYDGIADALKVNDKRFLPTYHYAEPVEHGRVVVSIMP